MKGIGSERNTTHHIIAFNRFPTLYVCLSFVGLWLLARLNSCGDNFLRESSFIMRSDVRQYSLMYAQLKAAIGQGSIWRIFI